MKRAERRKIDLSRRGFIKKTAVGVGATAMVGVSANLASGRGGATC
jgi:hypothetical protein